MTLSEETRAFLDADDTVDFVVRADDPFFDFMQRDPQVVLTQTLAGRYLVGYVAADRLDELAAELGAGFICCLSPVLGLLATPALEASGILQVQEQPYLDLTGRGVLVGIVDTGIDWTQPVFRYEDGSSKIRWLYDQTADGPPPEGFARGAEYDRDRLTAALRDPDAAAGLPFDEIGHGTFLASVAAGRRVGGFVGAAPDAEIVAVKLRQAGAFYRQFYGIPDGVPAYSATDVMIGVDYVLQKARQLGRPAAICLGLGTTFGGHDGSSVFEQYLTEMAGRRGVCLCAAAGNESGARHHVMGRLPATGATAEVEIETPSPATDLVVSIWNTGSDRLSVSVRSPSGELVSRIPARPGTTERVNLILEKATVEVAYYFPVAGSGGQLTLLRLQNATPGLWTVTLHGDIVLDGGFHAWLPLTGFVPPGVGFLSASPGYTVTVPATAGGPLACAAYDPAGDSLYPPSSWGPTRTGERRPDLAAPGVDVGGLFPYGPGGMSGTSVAAAVTAGAAALLLQWGHTDGNEPAMSTYQVRAYLIRGCSRNPNRQYPNDQWGYGTLQLLQTFDRMREQ